MRRITRREAMGLMGGTALLTGFLAYGMSRGGTEAITAPGQRQILPRPRLLTANEPLRAGKTVFPDGHDGFGYNGGIPGPTIRIRRGETFTRRVENLMDQPTTCIGTGCWLQRIWMDNRMMRPPRYGSGV